MIKSVVSLAIVATTALAQNNPPIITFGTGLSQGTITTQEQSIFSYTLTPGSTHGVMTHFWITGGASTSNSAIISYYIDGETTASISFVPSMACGVGFTDNQGPWGTEWFGKGGSDGAWYNNFRIPFQKSINITYKFPSGFNADVIYMIVRGSENLPVNIGGVDIPVATGARMNLQIIDGIYQPLEYVNVVDIPTGSGMIFQHTLSFEAANLNTLEGCYHMYTPYNAPFPGLLLSTGTEDYFISSYYFSGGEFRLPNSGFTHFASNSSSVTLSAYRFHHNDPLLFSNGVKMVWRNGDTTGSNGLKCLTESGGTPVGNPQPANLLIYTWVYTW